MERWSLDDPSPYSRATAAAVRELASRAERPMRAHAQDVAAICDLSIYDAVLMGAALTYELLNGNGGGK